MGLIPPDRPQNAPTDSAPRRYTDAGTFVERDGYVWEWCPSHPAAKRGSVLQHRLAMECALGRFLVQGERVHHENHCRWDNRPENLRLYSSHREHMIEHWQTQGRRSPGWIEKVRDVASDPEIPVARVGLSNTTVRAICLENGIEWVRRTHHPRAASLTEESVREALQGRSTREAAAVLGVHPMTLYNKFDHLLSKRTKPGALNPHRAEIERLVYKKRMPHARVAEIYGVSEACVHRTIQRWSRQDATSGDAAIRQRNRARRKRKLQRTEPSTAQASPSPLAVPQESGPNRHD